MKRGEAGRYQVTDFGGEEVRAFIPAPLPPDPPIALEGALQQLLEEALLALGRLDSVTQLLPNPLLFIYNYVRKEAVLSSQIEGTQSTLSDLLLFEHGQAHGAPTEDVVEVSNYVSALNHGLERLRGGFPLSNRLIREIHKVLLSSGRGSEKLPGEFRASQNWIGGTRPGNATYVPPPHTEVMNCMGALENFLHAREDGLPILTRAGMAHVQFEGIHPFLDGNGRVGRLLITLLLCDAGVLGQPLLYLSLYLKRHRLAYYDLLDEVRHTGDWERWLAFFFEGVRETAQGAVATTRQLLVVFEEDRASITLHGTRRVGSALRIHQALTSHPLLSLSDAQKETGLTFPGATSGMNLLVELGIAREITGRRRNRLFAYDRFLNVLNEGAEPL